MRRKVEMEFIEMDITDDKCSKCGECCRWIAFGAAYGGADWNEYYFRRGCEIKEGVGLLVPSVCPHLKESADGITYYCDIYKTRPELCHTDKKDAKGLRFYKHKGCTQL